MDFLTIANAPKPDPTLAPEDVIRIQLDALQNSDLMPRDEGIEVAYRFISPVNRSITPSAHDFGRMIRNPMFADMIGFERAEFGARQTTSDIAIQHVQLHHSQRRTRTFMFTLSRQASGPNKGCWLVDGMLPLA